MTFFNGLIRMLQGKPVFDSQNQKPANGLSHTPTADHADSPAEAIPASTVQKNNPATFPTVHIVRTQTKIHGAGIHIYCYFQNAWNDELELGKLRFINTTHDLHFHLHPHDTREVLVYDGPALEREQGREALLDYQTKSGDYFEAVYDIRYAHTSHDTYEITDMHLRSPIRDIYG